MNAKAIPFANAEREHLPWGVPLLTTTFFCPEWKRRADVTIGLDRSGPKARLGVVSCDLLRHGETCDLTCVGGNAQAQGC